MSYLVDTNVLLRLRDQSDPRYNECIRTVDLLQKQNERLYVCAQILSELWVVLTRPCDVNGCGLTFDDAVAYIRKVRTMFRCLTEPADIADRWQQIVFSNRVMGKKAHDARIAALMIAKGVTHILTLNPTDFIKYSYIITVTPQDILHQQI